METSTAVINRELVLAFAVLLEYPLASLAAEARACEELARSESEEAAALAGRFRHFAEQAPLEVLQEAYTNAFDLDTLSPSEPTCYPYIGHHLFEENHKRSAFLLGLRALYGEYGFADDASDLPDHLVTLLRFVASCDDDEVVAEVVDEALLPALARMRAAIGDAEPTNACASYQQLVGALTLALGARRPAVDLDAVELEWNRPGDSLGITRDTCGH
jgi:nitrate reductase delta subunit